MMKNVSKNSGGEIQRQISPPQMYGCAITVDGKVAIAKHEQKVVTVGRNTKALGL